MIKITFMKQCTLGFLHNHQKWKCNRYMRDKNKPTGKKIQVILTKKLPGHNVLKEMVKNRKVHLPGSICSRWPNWTQINPNKLKTWLNKWFSQFQQVSVHGPDCSRSRADCGTQEQDRCLSFGFLGNPFLYPLSDWMLWCRGTRGCYRENARTCVTPARPWVLSFNTSVTKVLGLCARTATK